MNEIADTVKWTFGIESEIFLAGSECASPTPDQIDRFLVQLAHAGNGSFIYGRDYPGQVLACQLSIAGHVVEFKNDFSTNILEIAYAPLTSPDDFLNLASQAWSLVRETCQNCGMCIREGAVIEDSDHQAILRPAPSDVDSTRLAAYSQRKPVDHRLFDPHYASRICSTQVSLIMNLGEWRKCVASLAEYEYLAPLLFNGQGDRNRESCSCRDCMIHGNWHEDAVVGFPRCDLKLLGTEDLDQLRRLHISPRSGGRIEFGSTDRMDSATQILKLVAFRFAQREVSRSNTRETSWAASRDRYFDARHGQKPATEVLSRHVEGLNRALEWLPGVWDSWCETLRNELFSLPDHQ